MKLTLEQLEERLGEAEERELDDHHLTTKERREIVDLYCEHYPEFKRTNDVHEDFVKILFD